MAIKRKLNSANDKKHSAKKKRKLSKLKEKQISSGDGKCINGSLSLGQNTPIPIEQVSETLKENSTVELDVTQPTEDILEYKAEDFIDNLISNNEPFQHMQNFMDQVNKMDNGQSEYDIIGRYLTLSSSCHELLGYLGCHNAPEKNSIKTGVKLYRCLKAILIYIGHNIERWEGVGLEINNRVLGTEMKHIYEILEAEIFLPLVVSALKLLIAMAAINPKQMIKSVNFSHPCFKRLVDWRPGQKPHKTRKCYSQFILAFLLIGDNYVVQQICSIKNLVNTFFRGIANDNAELIEHFLTTCKEKILLNPNIQKTLKIRVFNEATLLNVVDLLDWKGPFKKSLKSMYRKSEKETIERYASAEQIETVHGVALEFLKTACCSYKFGVIFKEVSQTAKKQGNHLNPNHTLTNLLRSIRKPLENQSKCDLILEILIACPEQGNYFLPTLKESLVPRLSPIWIRAMTFFIKAIESYDLAKAISNNKADLKSNKKISNSIGLGLISCDDIVKALKAKESLVRLKVLEYMKSVLNKSKDAADISKTADYTLHNRRTLMELKYRLLASVNKALPSPLIISNCIAEDIEDLDIEISDDQKAPRSDYIKAVLDCLLIYNEVLPEQANLESLPFDTISEVIEKHSNSFSPEQYSELQLNVLKLTALFEPEEEMNSGELNKSTKITKLLHLYIMQSNKKWEDDIFCWITNCLRNFNMDTDSFQLNFWLHELKRTNNPENVLNVLGNGIMSVIQKFHVYHDQILECKLSSKMANTDRSFDALNFEDLYIIYSNDSKLTTSNYRNSQSRQILSPLIPAVLEALESSNSRGCVKFVERTLCKILHSTYDPHSLCLLISKYYQNLSQEFREYISLWTSNSQVLELTSTEESNSKIKKDSSILLKNTFLALRSNSDPPKEDLFRVKIKSKHVVSLVQQTLLYIQYELDSVACGGNTAGIDIFMQFLDTIISQANCNGNESTDEQKLLKTEELGFVLKEVLKHPVILKWFLLVDEVVSRKYVMRIDTCVSSVTACLLEIVNIVKELTNNRELQKELLQEQLQFLQKSKDCILLMCAEKQLSKDKWDKVYCTFSAMVHLLTADDTADILDNISSSFGSSGHLPVETHKMFEFLFVRYHELNDEGVLLELHTISNLLKHIWLTDEGKKFNSNQRINQKRLYSFFERNQRSMLAISIDYGIKLLDISLPLAYQTAILFAETSPAHHLAFRDWVQNNFGVLVLIPGGIVAHLIVALLRTFPQGLLDDNDSLLETVGNIFWLSLSTVAVGGDQKNESHWKNVHITDVLQLMLKKKIIRKSSVKDVVNQICDEHKDKSITCTRLTLLIQIFHCFQSANIIFDGFIDANAVLIRLVITFLRNAFNESNELDNISVALKDINKVFKFASSKSILSAINDVPDFKDILKETINQALICQTTGIDVLILLTSLSEKIFSKDVDKNSDFAEEYNVADILKMIFNHSKFQLILLNQDNELPNSHSVKIKDYLLELLVSLIELDGSFCETDHIPLLLASYQATMTPTDQRVLCLLGLYEKNGVSLARFRPFYWGPSALTHYAKTNQSAASLWNEPKLDDIIDRMDEEQILLTILQFPLNVSLQPTVSPISNSNSDDHLLENETIYDPRFIFPIFTNLLEPGRVVDCRKFISSKCLGLVIVSLSSMHTDIRAAGWTILSRFYQHLETEKFYDQELWLNFLNGLTRALPSEKSRLSSTVAYFIVKCIEIMGKPDDRLYTMVAKYLLSKDTLQINYVPEFFKLFYSSESNHLYRKSFILGILKNGFRSNLDLHLCKKSYIIESVISYVSSNASNVTQKLNALEFIQRALSIYAAANSLYRDHAILAWISATLIKEKSETFMAKIISLMNVLWTTSLQSKVNTKDKVLEPKHLQENSVENGLESINEMDVKLENENTIDNEKVPRQRKHLFNASFPLEFLTVHVTLLESVKDISDIVHIELYLKTLCSALEFLVDYEGKLTIILNSNSINMLLSIASTMNSILKGNNSSIFSNMVFQCRKLALYAMLYWNPCKTITKETASLVFTVLKTVLEHENTLSFQLARWLRNCAELDSNKLLLKILQDEPKRKCAHLYLKQLSSCLSIKSNLETQKANKIGNESILTILNLGPMNKETTLAHFKKLRKIAILKAKIEENLVDSTEISYLISLCYDLWIGTGPSSSLSKSLKNTV